MQVSLGWMVQCVLSAGVADLGGAIITGIDGNPLAVLAHQLWRPLHAVREKCPMYLDSGEEAPFHLDNEVRHLVPVSMGCWAMFYSVTRYRFAA